MQFLPKVRLKISLNGLVFQAGILTSNGDIPGFKGQTTLLTQSKPGNLI